MQFRNVTWAAALALALLFVTQEAEAAVFTVCGSLDQTNATANLLYEQLASHFPLGAPLCAKLAKVAVAACNTGVSNAASCYHSAYGNAYKDLKLACTAAADPAQCNADAKDALDTNLSSVDSLASDGHMLCGTTFLTDFMDACENGLPM